jgi:predicted nucleic acid-binding protein
VKLFLDTNVILDLLTGRLPFKADADRLFSLADHGKVALFASSQSIATAYYVMSKSMKPEEARSSLQKLLTLIKVSDLNHKSTVRAINDLNFSDIEDSLQHQCAIQSKATILVTRNEKDFRKSSISVMTPKQVLAIIL